MHKGGANQSNRLLSRLYDAIAADIKERNGKPLPKEETFESLLRRAETVHKQGRDSFAAQYYLYCLEKFRTSDRVDLLAICLRRVADICYKHKKFEEAVKFRRAEKLLYEQRLLKVLDAERDAATASASTADNGGSAELLDLKSGIQGSRRQARAMFVARSAQNPGSSGNLTELNELIDENASLALSDEDLFSDPREKKAVQYERLARLFLKENNAEMAKSYVSRAIQIRNALREEREEGDGQSAARTKAREEKQALDYARGGVKSYREAMDNLSSARGGRNSGSTHGEEGSQSTDGKDSGDGSAAPEAADGGVPTQQADEDYATEEMNLTDDQMKRYLALSDSLLRTRRKRLERGSLGALPEPESKAAPKESETRGETKQQASGDEPPSAPKFRFTLFTMGNMTILALLFAILFGLLFKYYSFFTKISELPFNY